MARASLIGLQSSQEDGSIITRSIRLGIDDQVQARQGRRLAESVGSARLIDRRWNP